MKKIKKIVIFIFSLAFLVTGCASKQTQTLGDDKKMEEQNIEKKEPEFIRNGYSFDCAQELKTKQADVKYGTVSHVEYHSKTCNLDRAFSILLPPSYDGEKKFPVVYFQHGIFGDENCMIHDAKNAFIEITGNLAAQGIAEEFIMVFGHMYATTDANQKPSFSPNDVLPYDNYINELTNDIMPYVEANYAVLTGRENTAICGFSMGGRESLFIGLNRPDLFNYIGAIAPAPGLVPSKDRFMEHKGQMAEAELRFKDGAELPEFLMVCCGTQDSVVGQFPKTYHKIFEQNDVDHIWFEVMNADHNDLAIRSGFTYFAMNIFKK